VKADEDYQKMAAEFTDWWVEYGFWGEGVSSRWLENGDKILFQDEVWCVSSSRANEAIMRPVSTTYGITCKGKGRFDEDRTEYITITNVPGGTPGHKITFNGEECEIVVLPTLVQLLDMVDRKWSKYIFEMTGPHSWRFIIDHQDHPMAPRCTIAEGQTKEHAVLKALQKDARQQA
jgi:hypothetical protein